MNFGNMYGYGALDPDYIVDKALSTTLKRRKFDSIVGIGLSGALVIPHLAKAFDKTWAIVRKDTESTHSYYPIEGEIGDSWIFVDDLVQSGQTFRKVRAAVDAAVRRFHGDKTPPKFKGAWVYWDGSFMKPAEIELRVH